MSKQIYLSIEKKKDIASKFKVSRQTVWYALTFRTKRGVSDMIRAAAVLRGGVLIHDNGDFEPNLKFDTYFNETPRQMVQVFSPRVKMIVALEGGEVAIVVDDKVTRSFGSIPMRELCTVQAIAQGIMNNLKYTTYVKKINEP